MADTLKLKLLLPPKLIGLQKQHHLGPKSIIGQNNGQAEPCHQGREMVNTKHLPLTIHDAAKQASSLLTTPTYLHSVSEVLNGPQCLIVFRTVVTLPASMNVTMKLHSFFHPPAFCAARVVGFLEIFGSHLLAFCTVRKAFQVVRVLFHVGQSVFIVGPKLLHTRLDQLVANLLHLVDVTSSLELVSEVRDFVHCRLVMQSDGVPPHCINDCCRARLSITSFKQFACQIHLMRINHNPR
mmetsp:Transcript_63889/g.152371  ORF Transcript_63889/g.152371 Transcript_63889/m.152371 type:complete len:239 (-) Transcript_63889:823-1539(-)